MRPLAVLNAIIFGSAAAITFGLVAVIIIFLILGGRHPELSAEIGPLLRNSGQFAALTAVSGLSLFALLKELPWRWTAQAAMWFILAAITGIYIVSRP